MNVTRRNGVLDPGGNTSAIGSDIVSFRECARHGRARFFADHGAFRERLGRSLFMKMNVAKCMAGGLNASKLKLGKE